MKDISTQELLDHLQRWSAGVRKLGAPSVYVFGSLVYRGGDQFGASSDVDLVVTMPKLADAHGRHRWLESVADHKDALESQLLRLLRRQVDEPIVSIVAVTDLEVACDIHKDGHRAFFSENTFVNLSSWESSPGLPGAASAEADRFVAAAIGFAQKIRNEYFGVSPNNTPRLHPHISTDDAIPKRFMRAGAMANRAAGHDALPGAEHDLQIGLDAIFHRTHHLSKTAEASARRDWNELHHMISVRRKARGHERPVEASDQLLLAELIYDMAVEGRAPSGDIPPGAPPIDPTAPPPDEPAGELDGSIETATDDDDVPQNSASPAVLRSSTMPHTSTTALFSERFSRAFPGVRAIEWFSDPTEAGVRLSKLLEAPLVFADATPIWWWRGGNLQIESFEACGDGRYLMNFDELRIARIAAVPGSSYKRSFVYVETDPMDSTGLYRVKPEDIHAEVEQFGYAAEEYGVFRGEHLLTRAQYDDGAAMIDGKLTETYGESVLRIRYLTPYNFIIAAHGSPINNPNFDRTLEALLNRALSGEREAAVNLISSHVDKLPLREVGVQ